MIDQYRRDVGATNPRNLLEILSGLLASGILVGHRSV
jgi:hypothetical protein